MKIHERLKEYRLRHGLIQKYVAKQAGMSIQRYSALERGSIKLTADEFENICKYGYQVSPCIFFDNGVSETEKLQLKL